MSSLYPYAYDNIPVIVDKVTEIKADVGNLFVNSINAIEAELGLDPSATYGTVRARLDALEALIASLDGNIIVQENGVTISAQTTTFNFVGSGATITSPSPNVVDISLAAGDLETILSIGNNTGPNDIVIDSGQKLIGAELNLESNSNLIIGTFTDIIDANGGIISIGDSDAIGFGRSSGDGTGDGSSISIIGGFGGVSGGSGGSISIYSGDSDAGNIGNIDILTPENFSATAPGNINIKTFGNTGNVGNIEISANGGTNTDDGNIVIKAASSVNGNSGNIDIAAGTGANPGKTKVSGLFGSKMLILDRVSVPYVPTSSEGLLWSNIADGHLMYTNDISTIDISTLGGADLAATLALGNVTGANNIIVEHAQKITGETDFAPGVGGTLTLSSGESVSGSSGFLNITSGTAYMGSGMILINTKTATNTAGNHSGGGIILGNIDQLGSPGESCSGTGTTGNGASIYLVGGYSSATGGSMSSGGNVSIFGGNANAAATNGKGGNISIVAGDGKGTGLGGNVLIEAGAGGSSFSGKVDILSGSGASPGELNIKSGESNSSSAGGKILINAGNNVSTGNGGDIEIVSGQNIGSALDIGALRLYGSQEFVRGIAELSGGTVGIITGDGNSIENNGGDLTIVTGYGSTDPGANGGNIYFNLGGANTGSDGNGGSLIINPGSGDGMGMAGEVLINGKLTVTGLIDPTGLVLDYQGVMPFDPSGLDKGVLWGDTAGKLNYTYDDNGTPITIELGGGGEVQPVYIYGISGLQKIQHDIYTSIGGLVFDPSSAEFTKAGTRNIRFEVLIECAAVEPINIRLYDITNGNAIASSELTTSSLEPEFLWVELDVGTDLPDEEIVYDIQMIIDGTAGEDDLGICKMARLKVSWS